MYKGLTKALENGCLPTGNLTHVGTRTVILHHAEHCKAFGEGTNIEEALQIADLDYESNFHEGVINRQLPSLRNGDSQASSILDGYILAGFKLHAIHKDSEIQITLTKMPTDENDEMTIIAGHGPDLEKAIKMIQ